MKLNIDVTKLSDDELGELIEEIAKLHHDATMEQSKREIEAAISDAARVTATELVSLLSNPQPQAYEILSMWVKLRGLSHDDHRALVYLLDHSPKGDAQAEARNIAQSFLASPYDSSYLKQSSSIWKLLESGDTEQPRD